MTSFFRDAKPRHGLRVVVFLLACSAAPAIFGFSQIKPADQPSPANSGGTPETKTPNTTTKPPGGAAQIDSVITPAVPAVGKRRFSIQGKNFKDKVAVTLTDPAKETFTLSSSDLVSVTPTQVTAQAELTEGRWRVSLQDPGGGEPTTFDFDVRGQTAEAVTQAISAYWWAFWSVFAGLAVLLTTAIVFLVAGKWSLANALSEESAYQPKEITSSNQIILLASTSRVVALFGLIGILGIVIGTGYAVMWNLFLSGTLPELGGLKGFLIGCGAMFAPYIANQVRSAFDNGRGEASPPQGGATQSGNSPITLSAIMPGFLERQATKRTFQITGTGFMPGVLVTLTNPVGAQIRLPDADVSVLHSTLISAGAVTDMAGQWRVTVQNPGGDPSSPISFKVSGKPDISGVDPTNFRAGTPTKTTIRGAGFVDGLTIAIAGSAGQTGTAEVLSVRADQLEANVTLPTTGSYTINITNAGSGSAQQQLTAT